MSILVVVAEPEEIKLIPRAYKDLPVLVAGVGAKSLDTLSNLSPDVEAIINVGYCGSHRHPIGTVIYKAECETVDDFVEGALPDYYSYKNDVFDMECRWISRWCEENNVALRVIKVVSDNLNFKQYKEEIRKEANEAKK